MTENWHPENWDQMTLMFLKSAEGAEALALVRAAPYLLDACERAMTFLKWRESLGEENRAASLLDTINKLEAAINKAKGED